MARRIAIIIGIILVIYVIYLILRNLRLTNTSGLEGDLTDKQLRDAQDSIPTPESVVKQALAAHPPPVFVFEKLSFIGGSKYAAPTKVLEVYADNIVQENRQVNIYFADSAHNDLVGLIESYFGYNGVYHYSVNTDALILVQKEYQDA